MKRLHSLLFIIALLPFFACTKSQDSGDTKYFVTSINFTDNTYTCSVGQTIDLDNFVVVLPENAYNKQLKWESSDKTVATVSGKGIVTAIAKGECKIKATTTDGSGVNASVDVIVKEKTILVEDITFSGNPYTVYVGETVDLTKTLVITPSNAENKTLAYESLNTAIATVSSEGVVTGIAEGSCKIKASATDGSEVLSLASITVEKKKVVASYTIENASSASTGTYGVNDVWYVPGLSDFVLDTEDYKTGSSSVKGTTNGSSAVIFCKKYSSPINADGITKENGKLELILYVSDVTKAKAVAAKTWLEITSSGRYDSEEWDWNLQGLAEGSVEGKLVEGWNTLRVDLSKAGVTGGGLNLSSINFFRMYTNDVSGFSGVTLKLDSMRVYTE